MKKRKKLQQNEQLSIAGVPLSKEEQILDAEISAGEKPEDAVSEGQISIFDNITEGAMIDESVAREKLKEAIETEKPKKKRKSIITNLIFLAINICVLGFIINSCLQETGGVSAISEIFKNQGSRMWWLLGGVGLFALMFFADTMILYCLIKRSTGKRRLGLSYKLSAVGKYFDAITPFSVGGQPAQILHLTRAGVSPGISTSIPIIKFIIYNIVYTVVILVLYIFGIPAITTTASAGWSFLFVFFKVFAFMGMIFTALTSIIFILIGSGKIIGRSFVRWLVRLGYKLKIVKDYRKSYNKIMNQVLEYQSSIKYLRQNKGTLFACILFALLEVVCYFAIPFMVVMALGTNLPTTFAGAMSLLLSCMVRFVVCQMASVVIPLPGGTGMMEISFYFMFGVEALLGNTNVALGLLAWRFLSYYFIIIQGFIVSTTDSIVRMVKARKGNKAQANRNKAGEESSSEVQKLLIVDEDQAENQ